MKIQIMIDGVQVEGVDINNLENYLEENDWDFEKSKIYDIFDKKDIPVINITDKNSNLNPDISEFEELKEFLKDNNWRFETVNIEE